MKPLLLVLALSAVSWTAETPEVLVKVNGRPIRRQDVADRLWALHASDALNQMVDEALVEQALADFEAKASKKQREGWSKETETRLSRVRAQFKDEAAFEQSLRNAGVTLASLRRQIEAQVLRESLVKTVKKVEVSSSEVKDFFEANKDKLGSQQATHLRHLLVAGEQQARDLLIAIRVGADFAKLAGELSLDAGSKERGGDLGFVTRGMLAPELERAAFSLKPGQVSEVLRTAMGFHLLKAEEIRQAQPADFKATEAELTRAVLAQKVAQAWTAYVKELRAAAKLETSPDVTMERGR
jgi:foldase protein PrsA